MLPRYNLTQHTHDRHHYYWLLLFAFLLIWTSAACNSTTTVPTTSITPTILATQHATPSLPNASRVDTYLRQLANSGHLNGAVLLAHNGVIFSKGYGAASQETHAPNTPETMFRIGSVSKQFTAMAILILQERGKLHISDALCTYIANCPQGWQPITLKHLLTHSSGIPDYTDAPDFLTYWTQPQTPTQLIDRFKALPLNFAPGSKFNYSNSGYVLLGYIIEEVSGQSYANFLRENIFTPLNMAHSGYDSSAIQPGHAEGYYRDNSPADVYDISWAYAAGALYSSVEDLYTWDLALSAHRLVSQQSINDMFTVHILCAPPGSRKNCDLGTDQGYGYGWFIASEPLGKFIYHVGHIDGFFTLNGFYPTKNIQVIVLTNEETANVLQIGRDLARMV